MIVSLVYRYHIAACTYSNHSILQYRYGIQQTHTLLTYQKASTKNFPALFNIASSFCCVLLMNFTFRGLNNNAPNPNIGGHPAENASIVVAIVSMTMHIVVKKRECVIVCCVVGGALFLCRFCGFVQSVNATAWCYILI